MPVNGSISSLVGNRIEHAKVLLDMDEKRTIIVSGADDAYMGFLDDMLASIQDRLHEYDLGILDLGLSEWSRKTIRKRKPSAHIIDPGWRYHLKSTSKQPLYKKAYYAKPFLPDVFPGYSGYMWVDADVWLQDSSALEHYAVAAENASGKGAIAFECHPSYRDISHKPRFRVVRKFGILPIAIRMVGRKVFRLVYDMFGDGIAREYGLAPDNNSGLFFIHADSPAWRAWQNYLAKANHRNFEKRNYFPDQTCLNVALRSEKISFSVMPPTYNWVVGLGSPLLHANTGMLLDPCEPHQKLYAIHLTGDSGSRILNLQTTDGGQVDVSLKRSEFLRGKSSH